ncbi:MAG: type I-G CRISPR-associated protein Csb2 [Streptosporangiaceae bacterium]
MFAIAVELLAGRYTATKFNDRSQHEWPPHPARLFSAMVAAWADNDVPDPDEWAALRWLEEQDPPLIRCGEGHQRTVVTHYVPVNDPRALARDLSNTYAQMAEARRGLREAERSGDERAVRRAQASVARSDAKAAADAARAGTATGREIPATLQVLPEFRGKQGRTYPTVIPDEPTVWFLWPGARPTADQRAVLDALVGRVGRIGHSSTLVACRCEDNGPDHTWAPGRGAGSTRLRVPRAGLADQLEQAFATHRGEEPRMLPAGMSEYHRPGAGRLSPRVPLLGGDWYVLGITGPRRRSAVQALAITRACRNALLSHGDRPSPEILSGHQRSASDGGRTPPSERPHLAVVPLLNAGSPHSDGAVFGVALVLPADCPDDDREAVKRALQSWSAAGLELFLPARADGQATRLILEDLGVDRAVTEPGWLDTALAARRRTTTRDYWCRPARRWLTVTPVALDRFPGNLRSRQAQARDRAEAEASASVARACVLARLAGQSGEVRVTIRLDAPLVGIPASPAGRHDGGRAYFPGYQTGQGTPRACVHAEIEFAEPVAGPVLIGAGRYLGYGLCLPRPPKENTR